MSPIVASLNSADFYNSAKTILRQHLLDYFVAGSYNIIEDIPSLESLNKALIWIVLAGSDNLDVQRTRSGGKSVQRKELKFDINLFTNAKTSAAFAGPANHIRQMAATIERDAVLRDGRLLATAGLQFPRITPFVDIIEPYEAKYYRKIATMTVTLFIEAT